MKRTSFAFSLSTFALVSLFAHTGVTATKRTAAVDSKSTARASTAASSTISVKSNEKSKKAKSVLWSGSLGYEINTDLGQEIEPRLYSHRISTGGALSIMPNGGRDEEAAPIVTLGLGVDLSYKSIAREIDGSEGAVDVSDVAGYAAKSWSLGTALAAEQALSSTLGTTVPTGIVSQYEGYKAIPFADLVHSMSFQGGRFSLTQRLMTSYVVNTYDFSPSSKAINPDLGVVYRLGAGIKLLKGFSFEVGGSVKSTRFLDRTTTQSWSNTQTLTWKYEAFRASLRHGNGSHLTDRDVSLWFVDEYRRLVSFNMGYEF